MVTQDEYNDLKDKLAATQADLTTSNETIAEKQAKLDLVIRQLNVIAAGGQYHEAPWFDQHDAAINKLKAAQAANKTVDVVLFGDQVLDGFDEPIKTTYEGANQYDDFAKSLSSTDQIVVNFAIDGNTAGDVKWQVEQVLELRTGTDSKLPNIRYAIVNAGGNDLKNAGSTQDIEIGAAATEVVAKKVRGVVSELKTELGTTTKVGVLSPVYRGDLNDTDQTRLRDRTTSDGYYTSDGTPAPDYIVDSFGSINLANGDRFGNTEKTELSTKGYNSIRAQLQNIITGLGSPLVMAPKSKNIMDSWTSSARYLARGLDPRSHVMGA
jgi:lysophospholipase L1-like esterase